MNDESLVLLYYGELDAREAEALRRRLAEEPELAARFAALGAELDAMMEPRIPERDSNYGRRVWARVDAALDAAPARGFPWSRLRFAGGVLVLAMVAVTAFQMGRMTPAAPMSVPLANVSTGGEEPARLLQASLANHFDSADRLLTEIANGDAAEVNIESEKEWAKVLLVANRLYRYAAEQAGQPRIAQLLSDMEPVLIELANGAGQLTPEEYRLLRQSIAERDLVFKVRTAKLKPQQGSL